jgi:hypothetical protein
LARRKEVKEDRTARHCNALHSILHLSAHLMPAFRDVVASLVFDFKEEFAGGKIPFTETVIGLEQRAGFDVKTLLNDECNPHRRPFVLG